MGTLAYRQLEAADAEQVRAVALTAWRWTYRDIFDAAFIEHFIQTNYAPDLLRQTLSAIEQGQHFFEVVLDDERIVGFCHMGLLAHGARLFRIYLAPAYIGRGIGGQLLTHAEDWLHAKGIREYECFVHVANAIGKRFYAQRGFTHQAEHDHEDEWYMHKQLVP